MERLQRGYIALKGFAIAIAMGLLVYLVCLAERYVEAVEMEKRYYIPGGESEFEFRVDRKEGTIQMWNGACGPKK
jgi:hypothetical protein